MTSRGILILLFVSYSWIPIFSQPLSPMVASVPMRDGKNLAADVYLPSTCTQCPVILIQTPYNKNLFRNGLPLGVNLDIANSSYAFVVADWRGFYGSLSATVSNPDRGKDGYDLIDWIVQQTWSNGKVATWGPSALGKIQYETAREQHPAHICAVPLVSSPVISYTDYYYGGVLEESLLETLDALGYGLSPLVTSNQVKNAVWNFAESNSTYPADIQIPVLMIGGWYDHTIRQMLSYYNLCQLNSPAAQDIFLVIGPWVHGGTGIAYVGSAQQGELAYLNAAGDSDSLAIQFIDHHMLGLNNGWPLPQKIRYYRPGDEQWYNAANFPNSGNSGKKLYLSENFELSDNATLLTTASDPLVSDPKNPSPTIGGATLHTTLHQGPYDQSILVETRADVLSYTSGLMATDVTVEGISRIKLYFISDRKDFDISIRLTDVYPDGRSMLINDGIARARFRHGYLASDTVMVTPGNIDSMEVLLPPVAYTFKPGHKIRIDISGTNSRRWDINLNNGGDMLTAGDTLVATTQILRNNNFQGYIELPVVSVTSAHFNPFSQNNAVAFPNPATGSFQLMVPQSFAERYNCSIYDINGRIVKELSSSGHITTINAQLKSGAYIIQIQKDTELLHLKLIID